MNIPNILTLLRIIMVPVIVILLIQESFLKALIVFVAAGLTDILDGFLARFLHQQTVLGSYLDPIAAKALLVSSFASLSALCLPGGIREIWLLPLYWVTAFFTIVSGLNYMARGMKIINNDAKK